jgi:fibronectin type 3 domain-containing protein
MKRVLPGIMIGLLAGIQWGCLEGVTEAPLAIPGEGIEAPRGLAARAGDGTITLEWHSVEGAPAYRIYRSVDSADRFERIDETADTSYVDTYVQNGRLYYYAVSALSASKLEGKRSIEIVASPAVYAVTINGGDGSTRSTTVLLTFTAPATTENMMVAADPSLLGDVWGRYEPTHSWRLEGADGVKEVFVRFRDQSDVVSPVVSAAITLDTYAMIESIAISPAPYRYSPGGTVHFRMQVDGDERGGTASVSFEDYTGTVALYDDGRGGDASADDGVYERDFRLPESIRGTELIFTGDFTDEAGNSAPQFECPERISITDPPASVQLLGAVDSTRTSITIRWTASGDPHFKSYRIYRNTSAVVVETPTQLVKELASPEQTSYPDGGLKEGVRYYYRIFVVNDLDETAGSNTISARTFDAYPDPVLLDEPSSIGSNRVTLTWSKNTDTDFMEYRLYRSLTPGVTSSSTLVATIVDRERAYFDDTGLDLGLNTYHYRVYVFDLQGKSSRSNEVDTAP